MSSERRRRNLVWGATWLAYAGYYFGRKCLSAAKHSLKSAGILDTQALGLIDTHARMKRLDERARYYGLIISRHPDRLSIVVTPVPAFSPFPGAHERVLVLDEVLEHGSELFDFLEATDRMRAALRAGALQESSPAAAPAPSPAMPWWLQLAIAAAIAGPTYLLVDYLLAGSQSWGG